MLKVEAKVVLFLQNKEKLLAYFIREQYLTHCKNERTVAIKVYLKGSYNQQQQAGSVNSNNSQNNVVSCLSGQIR